MKTPNEIVGLKEWVAWEKVPVAWTPAQKELIQSFQKKHLECVLTEAQVKRRARYAEAKRRKAALEERDTES